PYPSGLRLAKYRSRLSGERLGADSQNSVLMRFPRFSGVLHPSAVRYEMKRSQLPYPSGKLQPVKMSHWPSCEIFWAPSFMFVLIFPVSTVDLLQWSSSFSDSKKSSFNPFTRLVNTSVFPSNVTVG